MKDYADMWHYIMDTVIDVENGKFDAIDAAEKVMNKFSELLSNNGMSMANIPTIVEDRPTLTLVISNHEDQ